jgi:hypothetical protein
MSIVVTPSGQACGAEVANIDLTRPIDDSIAVEIRATCLFGITIPPVGGNTLFADQHKALHGMPAELRGKLEGRNAIHSAGSASTDRSMDIKPSTEALAAQYVGDVR